MRFVQPSRHSLDIELVSKKPRNPVMDLSNLLSIFVEWDNRDTIAVNKKKNRDTIASSSVLKLIEKQ